MKPIYKWLLLLCALMIPYLAFALLFVAGRQVVPVWTRIVLGSSLLVIVIVLVISRMAMLPKNQQVTTEISRVAGRVRLLFRLYAIGIALLLLELLAQKKWDYIPSLIVPVLLALYLWKWLSSVKSRSSGESAEGTLTDHRCQIFFAISTLALMMSAPALSQSHATVHGNTLESVAGLSDPNAMNESWQTPLMAAALNADEKAVQELIARKANVKAADRFGMTPLMYAHGVPVVQLLLRAGASVNDKDLGGKTALHYATQYADPDFVRALIKAGANVNAKDDKGMSALQIAKLEAQSNNFTDKTVQDTYKSRVQRIIDLLVGSGATDELSSPQGVVGAIPGGSPPLEPGTLAGILSSGPPNVHVANPTRLRIAQGLMRSSLVTKVNPIYPPEAKRQRIHGSVLLEINIDKNGNVSQVEPMSGHPLLIRAAVDAVKQWKYKPYLLNNTPIEVDTTVLIKFVGSRVKS